ncbi:MAG: hypothetical protein COB69_00340 [Phycisphaera sp.]|nr:MAG: hypothetical protein COB69_00340 [Phycisphaera sp.]
MPFFGAGEFCQGVTSDDAPSNQLIAWVISHGFATGHAITEGDLLEELSEGIQDLYAVNDDLRAFKQQFITLHYVYKLLGVNK